MKAIGITVIGGIIVVMVGIGITRYLDYIQRWQDIELEENFTLHEPLRINATIRI